MAAQKVQQSAEKKKRSKKRKSRNEVSSSSDSESDTEVEVKKSRKTGVVEEDTEGQARAVSTSQPSTLAKKKKSKVPATGTSVFTPSEDPAAPTSTAAPKPTPAQQADDFNALYLRKITIELADDLDKVRVAQDFKASSVAMLVHALKQGGEVFSMEERRRFCRRIN